MAILCHILLVNCKSSILRRDRLGREIPGTSEWSSLSCPSHGKLPARSPTKFDHFQKTTFLQILPVNTSVPFHFGQPSQFLWCSQPSPSEVCGAGFTTLLFWIQNFDPFSIPWQKSANISIFPQQNITKQSILAEPPKIFGIHRRSAHELAKSPEAHNGWFGQGFSHA